MYCFLPSIVWFFLALYVYNSKETFKKNFQTMDVTSALQTLQTKGLQQPTGNLTKQIIKANTGSLTGLAMQNPNVKALVDIVNAQKAQILAPALPTSNQIASGAISFSDGITFNFPATTTPKIYIDGYGIATAVTGFARHALAAGGTYGPTGSDIVGKILQGSPQRLIQLIATKADGNFSAVTVRLIHCTPDGGTDYNKPLNFALGQSPENFQDSVLKFDVNIPADGYLALQVDTVAATDFALSMKIVPGM
jgi:hypothetical protein